MSSKPWRRGRRSSSTYAAQRPCCAFCDSWIWFTVSLRKVPVPTATSRSCTRGISFVCFAKKTSDFEVVFHQHLHICVRKNHTQLIDDNLKTFREGVARNMIKEARSEEHTSELQS